MKENILVLATHHVSEPTSVLMDSNFGAMPYLSNTTFGWFVFAQEERNIFVPDDLWAVMVHAQSVGCNYILFDRDANTVAELPVWEW